MIGKHQIKVLFRSRSRRFLADWDASAYLSRWFLIETKKSMKSPLFMFAAKNKAF